MSLTFPDVGAGYFGSNGPATGTITAYHLMQATGDRDPGRVTGAWSAAARVPYEGGDASLEGFRVDCASVPAGQGIYLSTRIEFDGGEFIGDYVGASTLVDCGSRPPVPRVGGPKPNRGASSGVRFDGR